MGRIQQQISGALNTAAQAAVAAPIIMEKAGTAKRGQAMEKAGEEFDQQMDKLANSRAQKEIDKEFNETKKEKGAEVAEQQRAFHEIRSKLAGKRRTAISNYESNIRDIDAKYIRRYGVLPSVKAQDMAIERLEARSKLKKGGGRYGK